jgi:predicted esterase
VLEGAPLGLPAAALSFSALPPFLLRAAALLGSALPRRRESIRAMSPERTLLVPALVHGRVLVRDPQPEPQSAPPSNPLPASPGEVADADAPPWQGGARAAGASDAAPLLLVCHGYGEGPEAALAAALRIPGIAPWRIVAPQGLHRFYTKTGEVVASWMTKQDREQTIADNVGYLAQVLAALGREHGAPRHLVVAGFSQGAAMAWRAAVRSGVRVDGLVVHGGDLPADVAAEVPATLPVLVGRGEADTWYGEDKLSHDLERLAARGLRPTVVRFAGGHEWGEELVVAIGAFLAEVTRG